ncbi:MAG TPA: carboxypeptidase-like regulatory domain-containing protein [Blastocatellia bacterium]|nr:carboxypeptidase-like regulatory domain-containing protein [Blastocatellia bacterium]HMZ19752.1 carboxypeptidase-like regulatory domain-containing protein [Blastocatellia bacterium]
MRNSVRPFVCYLLLTFAYVGIAVAQTNRGGISGTVSDKNGGVIPGAVVTITNSGTNQSQRLTTSGEGAFAATSLDPVTYRITVEAPGFKKTIINNIKVDTASIATANVVLEAGEVANEVTITADTPLLNTANGTASHTITERQIQDVPLFNRSVLDLALTAPNVSGDAGSEDPEVTSGQPVPGFNLNLNGGRAGSTAILADGVNNTGVGIARTVVSFTPETVQEFTVQTSAYSAEFGRTGGGVISATTKSGTNQFHGLALFYHRNPVTNARKWTTSTLRPANNYRFTQGSGTIGGPIWLPKKVFGPASYDGHDRTFFFFAYEPRWRRDFVITDTLLPTDAMRAGDFSGLTRIANGWVPTADLAKFPQIPVTSTETRIFQQFNVVGGRYVPIVPATGALFEAFPGNKLPANMIDPVALKAFEFLPRAGNYFINDAGQLSNFVVNRFVQQDETRYTTRIDHQLTKNDRLSFRFTKTPVVGVRGFGSDINGNSAAYSDSKQSVITYTRIFSPRLVNELRVNYTRGVFSEDFSPEFSIKTGRNLSNELGIPTLTKGGMPLFNVSADGPNAFASIGSSGSTNNFNVEERYNINDIVNFTQGSMTWKFGADLNHELLNVTPFFGAAGGRWDFRALNTSNNRSTATGSGGITWASYLLGVPNAVQARAVLIPYYYRWQSAAGFVQNDWKVKPNLTVNLGLRYSLQLPRTEKYNRQGVFRPDLAQTVQLTDAQRRAVATGLGIATTAAIPSNVPTSVLIPPFAYAGRGGRSKYLFPVQYKDFEPRFGFAWNPQSFNWMKEHHFAVRGGYGISHAPLNGQNRTPNPDYGTFNGLTTNANGSSGSTDLSQPFRLSGVYPIYLPQTPEQVLAIPEDGLVFGNSLGIPGFVLGGTNATPYTQNWNLSLSWELAKNTVIEVAYVGNKGTHLYSQRVNLNPRDLNFVESLEANNLSSDTTFADPLGRRSLTGTVLNIERGNVGSKYFGFNNLFGLYDASVNSIRHAGYVDVRRRVRNGLAFTANYTFGKSIDEASDSSPETRSLTTGTISGGHITFGAPRSADRAVSTFDVKHAASSTVIWDLPFGRGRKLLTNANRAVDATLGGWTVSSLFRLQGGYPFIPTIVEGNRLSSGITHTIRPDLVSGVPLKNPLWSRDCAVGTLCEPYVNPAAFMRPAKGELGTAPRTLDIRGPVQRYFDVSFQKDFKLGGDGKRRVQFRVDMNNALNSPIFRIASGTGANINDFMALPDETAITTADYDAWAAFASGRPARTTAEGAALFTKVQNYIVNARLPVPAGTTATTGALPLDYYANVRLPQGFATKDANSFDLSTIEGFKLYRLRRAYQTGFGNLRELQLPRYIQFGIKIYF